MIGQTKELRIMTNWALILGGSKGLGLATAQKLAREGYGIFIIHRDRRADSPDIENGFDSIRSTGVPFYHFNADALNPEKRKALIEEIASYLDGKGRIKVLVHSIAKGNLKPMLSRTGEKGLTGEDLELTIRAMATSLYDWTQLIYQSALFGTDSRVLAFTSEGSSKAMPYYGAVSAAKAALEAIVRSMAVEMAPVGIRVNCIQAGVTDTESLNMIPGSDKLKAWSVKRNPFGRLTKPEDVANVASLLCRDEAAWITGSVIKADGGESIR